MQTGQAPKDLRHANVIFWLPVKEMPRPPTYPKICIALGFEDADNLGAHARNEADAGGNFFEFRIDYLKKPAAGPEVIRKFLAEYPDCRILATCRLRQNNGKFNGGIEEQLRILEASVKAGARLVDVEIESAEKARPAAEKLRSMADLILSYHNFTSTPVLENVLRRMLRVRATAYKIVTTSRKQSDNYRVLKLARANPRVPLIILAMGEIGFPVRVASLIYGGLYTYASPESAGGTASGQVSARQLRHVYHLEKLSRKTKIYGVIADPVGHSISPNVHNRGFQCRRLDAVYLPFLVPSQRLRDFFDLAGKLPVSGFSVTIPHKEKVVRYLDAVDPLARRIRAVNTVWRKAGKWRGTNTDVDGVIIPLSKHLRLSKSSVLVVGSGGAARGAAFALSDQGATVSISGRDADRAQILALARACAAEPIQRSKLKDRYFDAIVHATPLGMHPAVSGCFFDDKIPADVVLDMVYNPIETTLIRRAREQKKTDIPGVRMFVEQAIRQFEIWTGGSAPRSVMEKAAREALAAQSKPIIKK